jgi:hypothetical protein
MIALLRRLFVIGLYLSWFSVSPALADEPLQYYSSNKTGMSFPLLSEKKHKASVYLFADESTCFTCLGSIKNMYAAIEDTSSVEFFLFVRTKTPAFITKLREKYKFAFGIEADPVSAYHRAFNVLHDPYMMLLDDNGTLRFHGVPGTTVFNVKEYTEALSALLRVGKPAERTDMTKPYERFAIRVSQDSSLPGDKICSCLYLPERKQYLYWGKNHCALFLLDEQGSIVKSADFSRRNFGIPLFEFGNVNPDSMIVINMHQDGLDVFAYNMGSDLLLRLRAIEPTETHYPSYLLYRLNNRSIAQGLRYSYEDSLTQNAAFPSLWLWDQTMTGKREVAGYDEATRNNPVRRFFHQAIAQVSNDTIAVAESMSSRIHLYSPAFTHLGVIECLFDSSTWNYRQLESIRAINGGPIELYKQLSDSVTRVAETQGLLFDSIEKKLYVVYEHNTIGDDGLKRPKFVVHLSSVAGSHWEMPQYDKPIAIHNGVIHCVSSRDGVATLSKYYFNQLTPP